MYKRQNRTIGKLDEVECIVDIALEILDCYMCIRILIIVLIQMCIRDSYHTIREVNQVLTPLEPETVEQDREYLEVVVLLVTYYLSLIHI